MSGLSIFPALTQTTQKFRPERLLLLCHFDHRGIVTVPQNIAFLQRFSKFEIDVYNFLGCNKPYRLPESFDLGEYAGIVLHNSLAYDVENLLELDAHLSVRFKDYGGIKAIFKQDENYKARRTAAYLGENKFDVVFTCLPESERQKVYPREVVGDIEFTQMLTGYVTPDLRDGLFERYNVARDIDVGYRGSLQPLEFGRLCYEKQTIGRDFLDATQGMSLRCDISSRWEDRFSGDDWLRFLCRCKAVLGVESGASIFDLDGEVQQAIDAFKASSPVSENSLDYPEKFLEHLKPFEGNVYYNQISPRHLEAAATKTLQIMFEGQYSGILVSGKHFVELKRDFSNIDDVVEILREDSARKAIVEAAYRDIIEAPTYWVETFAAIFDDAIQKRIDKRQWAQPAVMLAPLREDSVNVLLLCAHRPERDPRIGWLQRNAPAGMVIHVLATNHGDSVGGVTVAGDAQSGYAVVVDRASSPVLALSRILPQGETEAPGAEQALLLQWMASMLPGQMPRIFGITESQAIFSAQSLGKYMLSVAGPLVEFGGRIRGIDAIIACDLETLLPAVFLKSRFSVPLIYDAHEFWPDSYDAFTPAEFEFWQGFERKLLEHTDEAVTVSPGLATFMSNFYGRHFGFLPNCEPRTALHYQKTDGLDSGDFRLDLAADQVAFVVQAGFGPGRGFELLIDAWHKTDRRAKLFLRGPDGAYKQALMARARNLNLLGTRILFPEAVSESELVAAASYADVGIIPYEPKSINNRYCGPNKLSQYLAAGIPVLSNRLQFVEQILCDGDCGVVADFTDVAALVECVDALAADAELRRRLGENARTHFASSYNWNVVSQPFYASITALVNASDVPQRVRGVSTIRAALPIMPAHPVVRQWARPIVRTCLLVLWRSFPLRARSTLRTRARAALTRVLSVL